MNNRFHLFAHRQYAQPLAQAKGGMDNYIGPCASLDAAKAQLSDLNSELTATKGATAIYDYAQVAVLSERGRLIVVSTFDASNNASNDGTGWNDTHDSCGCGSGACDSNGPLPGYIVRRPVPDRSVSFDVIGSAEDAPMGYLLVDDPRPGEEIYDGRFEKRARSSTHLNFGGPATTVYDPVGAFAIRRFGE
jgi:hypothetical protein